MLLVVDLAMAANHLAWLHIFGKVPNLFDVDGEANIPTWWSSAQLFAAALPLALLAFKNHRVDRRSWGVALLSGVILFLSIDETACFHERLGEILDTYLGGKAGTEFSHTGYWPILVGPPAVVAIGYVVWLSMSFLSGVRGATARFIWSFAVLFSGAIGVELLNNLGVSAIRPFVEVLEEGLEMVGGSLLVWSACDLMRRHPSTADAWRALSPLNTAEPAAAR